jgi:hypothetical protein
MSEERKVILGAKLVSCLQLVKSLLKQINEIEADTQTPANEKLFKIKNIRKELNEVGTEIDSVKKEVNLLRTYHIN